MRYLIVGGGIAGLYTCLKLVGMGISSKDILIVEKSYRWGRRVHTLERDGIVYECGAGRFPRSHPLLMELVQRYGLEPKMIKLSKKHEDRQVLNGRLMIATGLDAYLDKLLSIELDKKALFGKTLFDVASEMFGVEIANLLMSSHGFDDDFKVANAYDGLKLVREMYAEDFYVLAGGLEQFVAGLKAELERAGVQMRLNTKCVGWSKSQNGQFKAQLTGFSAGEDSLYETDKIILALDKWGLESFNELEPIHNLLDSVAIVPLTRIYAKFPVSSKTGLAWFHGIPKTTTNLPIRMFIPINETNGFCMISYSDSYYASKWQDDFIHSDLEVNVMRYIRQLFPEREIPGAEWIQKLHWANGVHSWRVNVRSDIVYGQIQNPFRNIYICGEAFSQKHGWIEGSLETAAEVANLIVSNSQEKTRLYTMDEVARSPNLTVIQGRVYNLFQMDWLSRHPGGDIIKKAVGKDATHMFEYIGHPAYTMNILEDLYVGDLAK